MAELAQLPGVLDLTIYRGDDTNFQVTITDTTTGDPMVLPTSGWLSQVREEAEKDSPVVFTITVDAASAATGVLGLSIDGADTADVEGPYLWDLENTTLERTFLAGKVRLQGQVTRGE